VVEAEAAKAQNLLEQTVDQVAEVPLLDQEIKADSLPLKDLMVVQVMVEEPVEMAPLEAQEWQTQ
jgi:hypothetical protein|tara:strand:+ start:355 stop:549 length:195 start_codon:yes stop_codon:yes gene_type:complete